MSLLKVVLKTVFIFSVLIIATDISMLVIDRVVAGNRIDKVISDIEDISARNNGVPVDMVPLFEERFREIEEKSFLLAEGSITTNLSSSIQTENSSICSAGYCRSLSTVSGSYDAVSVYDYGETLDVYVKANYRWYLLATQMFSSNGGGTDETPSFEDMKNASETRTLGITLPDEKHTKVYALRLLK